MLQPLALNLERRTLGSFPLGMTFLFFFSLSLPFYETTKLDHSPDFVCWGKGRGINEISVCRRVNVLILIAVTCPVATDNTAAFIRPIR